MKNLKFIFALITICLLASYAPSYAQPWLLAGNALTNGNTVEKFGSTNQQTVRFVTNNTERMRLTSGDPNFPSTLLIGGTTGFYDGDGNKTVINLALDAMSLLPKTYGANVGGSFRSAINGGNGNGTAGARLASASSWNANGGLTGLWGGVDAKTIKATSGNSAAIGGHFTANFTNAQMSSTGTNSVKAAGSLSILSGTIATYPATGYVAAVAAEDQINAANTWAGYFSGKVYCSSSLFVASDKRFKNNIRPLSGALSLVNRLRGVRYEYRSGQDRAFATGQTEGFLAQEVREVLPELVHEGNDGFLAVNYIGIIPVLNEAIKELKSEKDAEIATLEAQMAHKDQQINTLETRLAALEALMGSTSAKTTVAPVATLKVRPNPTSDVAVLDIQLSENVRQARAVLTDWQGKTLLETGIADRSAVSVPLALAGLPAGTYLCTVWADGAPVSTGKVVKQ